MALEEIKMPQLGESVTEGTIVKWLVSVGDSVNKYDPLAEIMTDKVTAEIPSSSAGVVKEIIVSEDETVETGKTLCLIENRNNETSANSAGGVAKEDNTSPQWPQHDKENKNLKIRYSPAVLKLSQEHGIDLQQVKGTGAEGRVTRKDIIKIIESGGIPSTEKGSLEKIRAANEGVADIERKESKNEPDFKRQQASSVWSVEMPGDTVIPVTGVRKAIAANMLRSIHEIPHAWTMVEVDVTKLVQYRNAIKDEFMKKEGFNLTFFAFFVKAVAQALKEFPEINSMWNGDTIVRKKEINISIAVASEDALYVPVIKGADEKTIKGIAGEISSLSQKVKSGRLTADDISGGTFTVNNTGSFGSVQSKGIINYPQAAILQVETIMKRPVVINEMIAIRDMVNLCLSLDHRILDGLICGRFLQRLKEILETISKENTSVY